MIKRIAHRGAGLELQEDTLPALELAAKYGAYAVECDPRYTKDGKLVIYHDNDLMRLAGSPAKVSEITLAEMREILGHKGLTVNTFEEILSGYHGASSVLFDLCFSALDPALFETMAKAPFRAMAGVHAPEEAAVAAKILPRDQILAFMPRPSDAAAFRDAGAGILRLWEQWTDTVTPRDIKAIAPDREVWIMSCDPGIDHPYFCMNSSPESIRRAEEIGADGILLNDIKMAMSL